MGTLELWPLCPKSPEIQPYDYENLPAYIGLVCAETRGASFDEMIRRVFPGRATPKRKIAHLAIASYLARARWLYDQKFGPLMWTFDGDPPPAGGAPIERECSE